MVLGVGGGTRVRHTVSIAMDLGIPTGGVAQLVGAMEEANAVFLNALLAKHGSIVMQREHFWELPLYLESGMLPIVISIPPYHFWEPPPEDGPLPAHGSDFGLFIHAEVLGMRRIVFVKDEDGLYTKDPKKHEDAELIRKITLKELEERMPEELIIDRQLFSAWKNARHIRRVQIVNGLKRGQLTRAMAGEDVGTVIEEDAMMERRRIESALADTPLTSSALGGFDYSPVAMMPDVKVLKIGGQSVMDRGRAALFPILDEVVAAKDNNKLLLCCGGGTRARHIYAVASDLELPTGVLAALGGYVPRQNARMLQMLLAKHGGLFIMHDDFEKLPLYFRLGCIPIMTGMPPFGYWEKPTENGRIPQHRTDAGVFLTAEVLGSKRAIFVKDEDGLFEDDPKKNPQAKRIPRIGAKELLARDLPDLVLERVVIEYLARARFCHELQIIDGTKKGTLTRALEGEDLGTIIYKD